jgi:hypothetical protein
MADWPTVADNAVNKIEAAISNMTPILVEAVKDRGLGLAELCAMVKKQQEKGSSDMLDVMNACSLAAENVSI